MKCSELPKEPGPQIGRKTPSIFRGPSPWSESLGTGPGAFFWASSASAMWGTPLTGWLGYPSWGSWLSTTPNFLILDSFKRHSWQRSYLPRRCQALNNRGMVFKGIRLLGMALFCFAQIKIVEYAKYCSYRRVTCAHVEFLLFARNLFQPVMVDTHGVHLWIDRKGPLLQIWVFSAE